MLGNGRTPVLILSSAVGCAHCARGPQRTRATTWRGRGGGQEVQYDIRFAVLCARSAYLFSSPSRGPGWSCCTGQECGRHLRGLRRTQLCWSAAVGDATVVFWGGERRAGPATTVHASIATCLIAQYQIALRLSRPPAVEVDNLLHASHSGAPARSVVKKWWLATAAMTGSNGQPPHRSRTCTALALPRRGGILRSAPLLPFRDWLQVNLAPGGRPAPPALAAERKAPNGGQASNAPAHRRHTALVESGIRRPSDYHLIVR